MATPDQTGQSGKDPITCHVLDITTGLPAVGMSVKLKIMSPPDFSAYTVDTSAPNEFFLKAKTNANGRITNWDSQIGYSIEGLMERHGTVEQRSVWLLVFDIEEYFGEGKGFFPTVEVRFYMNNAKGSHVHVPLLIGPYSYTTYRGS